MNPRHAEAEAEIERRALESLRADLTADLAESVASEEAIKLVAQRLAVAAPFEASKLADAYETENWRQQPGRADAMTLRFCAHLRGALQKRWEKVL